MPGKFAFEPYTLFPPELTSGRHFILTFSFLTSEIAPAVQGYLLTSDMKITTVAPSLGGVFRP